MVGIGGSDWGCFFNMMVWELALRLADLFLLHPEILCLCCAFLKALHYLRVRLVNTIQHIEFLVSSISDTRNTRQRSQFVPEHHHDSRTKEHDDGAASEIFLPHL